jgi:hypothetical protein
MSRLCEKYITPPAFEEFAQRLAEELRNRGLGDPRGAECLGPRCIIDNVDARPSALEVIERVAKDAFGDVKYMALECTITKGRLDGGTIEVVVAKDVVYIRPYGYALDIYFNVKP